MLPPTHVVAATTIYNNWKRWRHQAQNGSAGDRAVGGLANLLKEGIAAEKLAIL